jgi:hypothetical protein
MRYPFKWTIQNCARSVARAQHHACIAHQPHPLELELANYAWILLENKGFSGEENEKELLKLQKNIYADCVLADSQTAGAGCCQTAEVFWNANNIVHVTNKQQPESS